MIDLTKAPGEVALWGGVRCPEITGWWRWKWRSILKMFHVENATSWYVNQKEKS